MSSTNPRPPSDEQVRAAWGALERIAFSHPELYCLIHKVLPQLPKAEPPRISPVWELCNKGWRNSWGTAKFIHETRTEVIAWLDWWKENNNSARVHIEGCVCVTCALTNAIKAAGEVQHGE